ncbi:MAG: ParB/RepB/Spo0J family partition protein [Gracilibacteraceae bacterium]|jgi:ParB family chromosome partitioning protein|nr:ParB/RepB/Spo0J family partition protein [Gracilibacteraceae bacterium]
MPEQAADEIREIFLRDISSNPEQPRRDFDQQKIRELADSIQAVGLVQPVLVRPDGDGYRLIAGERRFRACKLLNRETIKCIVIDCSELEMTEMAIVENVQRADLLPAEEGAAYARLIEQYGLTQEQVAQRVGKARSTVANLLRIIQLPVPVLSLLNTGELTSGHAKALLSLPEQAAQEKIAARVAAEGWSVRETEERIAFLRQEEEEARRGETEKAGAGKRALPRRLRNKSSAVANLAEELQKSLQTRVFVKGDETKGKIEIYYYSTEELNRLLELWQVDIE